MKIQVELTEKDFSFDLGFTRESSFNISFSESFSPSGITPYSGSYEAIPRVTAQSLPTQDRWLDRDVVIQAIPYHEVENKERGTTAIIGGI